MRASSTGTPSAAERPITAASPSTSAGLAAEGTTDSTPAWRSLWNTLREPVRAESRALLRSNWSRLPSALQTPRQMLGRQGNGCGATIGAMPRCDFACRGCYLGDGANGVPAASVEELKAQMRALRPMLGPAGNLQITDGEVTLRDTDELIELLRYARSLELVPMLMTHGDSFRRRPGLLERLIVEGGLREISIHVDTTQRGRKGSEWRNLSHEAQLNPFRDEFADMLRDAIRTTGIKVRSATTLTVTRDNLDAIPDVMRWLVHNADVFHLVSFQPIAQVGRTEDGFGGGVTADALWEKIAEGVSSNANAADVLSRGSKWLGHPDCNRFVHGLVYTKHGQAPTFHPVRDDNDPIDRKIVDGFLARFGGISFRADDSRRRRLARMLGVLISEPGFMVRSVPVYAWHWMKRFGQGGALRAATSLLGRSASVHGLAIVSHHFMSAEQINTAQGKERLEQCVFHLSVNGQLVSMCEVNALGVRDEYYAQLSRASAARDKMPIAAGELACAPPPALPVEPTPSAVILSSALAGTSGSQPRKA